MQTGLNNQESVAQILRNVSQRRRHGLLELRFADVAVKVLFVQGKVVEVVMPDQSPVVDAYQRLLEAGHCGEFEQLPTSYAHLSKMLTAQTGVDDNTSVTLVRRAVRHAALNRLYSLDLGAPAFTNFDASMVEYEREFAPMISIGQLLLDVVALQADRPRFLTVFGPNVLISHGENPPSAPSEDEALIHSLVKRAQPLADLRRRSMLSDFALQDGLLRLHEQNCVQVREAPRQEGLREELLGSDILSELDASIDEVFETEGLASDAIQVPVPEPQVLQSPVAEASSAAHTLSIADNAVHAVGQRHRLKQRLTLASTRAMHAYWVPALVMLLFLMSCILIPLFMWQRVFEAFAG